MILVIKVITFRKINNNKKKIKDLIENSKL